MKIFSASVATRTNTFSPLPTDLQAFRQTCHYMPGFHPVAPTLFSAPLVAARRMALDYHHQLVEGTTSWAVPGGPLTRSAWEKLRDNLLDEIRSAMPVEMIVLGLHGAMVAEHCDDCEGDLLVRVRDLVGPLPVVGAGIDTTAHLSTLMVEAADVVVSTLDRTGSDATERAAALVELCRRTVERQAVPTASIFDLRRLGGFATDSEPGRSFLDRMRALEGQDRILSVSIIQGFETADVTDAGIKVLVYADGDDDPARQVAKQIAAEIASWPEGEGGLAMPIDMAVAAAQRRGKVILSDRLDCPLRGVAADNTALVYALLREPDYPSAIAALWDPMAVALCRAAGEGACLPLRFGGKATAQSGTPVDATVKVRAVSGSLTIPFGPVQFRFGPAAAVTIGEVDIVLTTQRGPAASPEIFTGLGIDLAAKRILALKCGDEARRGFAGLTTDVINVDCGGPVPASLSALAYRRVRRPIAPLDTEAVPSREPGRTTGVPRHLSRSLV